MRALISTIVLFGLVAAMPGISGRDASTGVPQVSRDELQVMISAAAEQSSALFVRFYMNG